MDDVMPTSSASLQEYFGTKKIKKGEKFIVVFLCCSILNIFVDVVWKKKKDYDEKNTAMFVSYE